MLLIEIFVNYWTFLVLIYNWINERGSWRFILGFLLLCFDHFISLFNSIVDSFLVNSCFTVETLLPICHQCNYDPNQGHQYHSYKPIVNNFCWISLFFNFIDSSRCFQVRMIHVWLMIFMHGMMTTPEPMFVRIIQLFVRVVVHTAKVCQRDEAEDDVLVISYEYCHFDEDQNECNLWRLHHQCIIVKVFVYTLILWAPCTECWDIFTSMISLLWTNRWKCNEENIECLISHPSVHCWKGAMNWNEINEVHQVTTIIFVLSSLVNKKMQNT